MNEPNPPDDRRRDDRRSDWIALGEFPMPELRRAMVTGALLLLILVLFAYMIREVMVGIIAGVVLGAYMVPFHGWLRHHLKSNRLTAIVAITAVTVPLVATLAYSWVEISGAAEYLTENRVEVARELDAALHRLPYTEGIEVEDQLTQWVGTAANQTTAVVDDIQDALGILVISIAVFLFTVFYVLTDHEAIIATVSRKIPGRYRALTGVLRGNIQAVVYGALYATFLTQLMKSSAVLAMNLIFDVPLAVVLAIVSFFIGFFPIVGSWSVYVPTAIYLIVFQNDVLGGVLMLLVGFFGITLFLSLYLRPKIAAEKSEVLNIYWMFIALVTGVYTFGLVGIIVGPVLIAVLKALFDSITEGVGPLLMSEQGALLESGASGDDSRRQQPGS